LRMARESAGLFDQELAIHLAVGRQREISEVERAARRRGGLSGRCGRRVTAQVVSRRAFPCLPRSPGDAKAACPGGEAKPDRKGVPRNAASRSAIGATRWGSRVRPSPSPGPAPEDGRVPPGRRRRWG
jgi:hypothetical protein